MPPSRRKSVSPSPAARSTPTADAKAAASSKKASPAARASKSPARSKKDAAAKDAKVTPSNGSNGTAAASATAAAAKSNGKQTSSAKPTADNTYMLVALAIGVLVALVGGAAYWPLDESAKEQKVPVLSNKAFNGMKLHAGRSSYNGSALIAFTLNVTAGAPGVPGICEPCVEFDALTRRTAFKKQLATWWSADILRIGKVYCNQQQELCSRFGVDLDGQGDAPGIPHILWFKGGQEHGEYQGERTLDGLATWVAEKQAENAL